MDLNEINQKKNPLWHKFYIIPFTSTNYYFKDILIVGKWNWQLLLIAKYSKGNIDAVEID